MTTAAAVEITRFGPYQRIAAFVGGDCLYCQQRIAPQAVTAQDSHLPGDSCRLPAAFIYSLCKPRPGGNEIGVCEVHVCQCPQENRAAPTSIECFLDKPAGLEYVPVIKQFLGTTHH